MSFPKITVVTTSYNQGEFLEETISSVINQGYPNLEYIIIDGGSNDNSVDTIKKYSDKLSYWISEPDKGQSDGLNKGFKIATGDLIGWLNSDDLYCENALFTMAHAFSRYPEMDLIYGNNLNIDTNSNVMKVCHNVPYIALIWKLGGLFFCQPASFFKRSVFDVIGYLDVNLDYCMDNDLFFRMLKCGMKFKHIDSFIAQFRYHDYSKTVHGKNETYEVARNLWIKYYGAGCRVIDKPVYAMFQYLFRSLRFANNTIRNIGQA